MLGPILLQGFFAFYIALLVYVWARLGKELFLASRAERHAPVKSGTPAGSKATGLERRRAWRARILSAIRGRRKPAEALGRLETAGTREPLRREASSTKEVPVRENAPREWQALITVGIVVLLTAAGLCGKPPTT